MKCPDNIIYTIYTTHTDSNAVREYTYVTPENGLTERTNVSIAQSVTTIVTWCDFLSALFTQARALTYASIHPHTHKHTHTNARQHKKTNTHTNTIEIYDRPKYKNSSKQVTNKQTNKRRVSPSSLSVWCQLSLDTTKWKLINSYFSSY